MNVDVSMHDGWGRYFNGLNPNPNLSEMMDPMSFYKQKNIANYI